jgi:UDP-apiose/xylose synthase
MTAPAQPRRICLLGGGGFLGAHLVQALIERTPHRLVVIDTSFAKLESLPGGLGDRLRLRRADIRSPGVLVLAVGESDVLLSLTALCNPALYNTQPRAVIEASFSDLVPLVSLCTTQRRWLVHFSTCEVYGKTIPPAALSEESPMQLGPIDRERWTYACAKQLLERLIWARGAHDGLPFTIIRPFNVIGPRMDYMPGVDGEGTPRVLACFMHALLTGKPLQLVDGGRQRRSFCAVDDFVEAVLRVLERGDACRGEVINVGNPRNDVSIAELAKRLAELYVRRRGGERPLLEPVAARQLYGPGYDDVEQRVPDIRKAQRLLDWVPRLGLDEMLPPIVDDYLARYGEPRPAAPGR